MNFNLAKVLLMALAVLFKILSTHCVEETSVFLGVGRIYQKPRSGFLCWSNQKENDILTTVMFE